MDIRFKIEAQIDPQIETKNYAKHCARFHTISQSADRQSGPIWTPPPHTRRAEPTSPIGWGGTPHQDERRLDDRPWRPNPKYEAAVQTVKTPSLAKPKYEAAKPKDEAAKLKYGTAKPKYAAAV